MDLLKIKSVDLSRLPEDFCASVVNGPADGMFHYVGSFGRFSLEKKEGEIVGISTFNAPIKKETVRSLIGNECYIFFGGQAALEKFSCYIPVGWSLEKEQEFYKPANADARNNRQKSNRTNGFSVLPDSVFCYVMDLVDGPDGKPIAVQSVGRKSTSYH